MNCIEITAFQDVTVSDTETIQNSIQVTLDGFNQVAKYESQIIQSELVSDEVIQTCVNNILNEGKQFCKLTKESASVSQRIVNYCTTIISYVETLRDERVTGEDFLSALEELLLDANKCKNEAATLKEGYTQIYYNLNEILEDLQEHENYLHDAKVEEASKAYHMNEEKKGARRSKRTGIAMTAGMTALAPFINGLSLAAVPFISQYTNKNAEKERNYRASRDLSLVMVSKFDDVIGTVRTVITQTNSIIEIVGHFQVFWDKQVNEINKLAEKFEDKKTRDLRYNRLTAAPVIKEWGKVRNRYSSYSTNIGYLLNNNFRVSRRIETD
jgi:hypothetical protein